MSEKKSKEGNEMEEKRQEEKKEIKKNLKVGCLLIFIFLYLLFLSIFIYPYVDAIVGFKLNGGTQLASQLEKLGFHFKKGSNGYAASLLFSYSSTSFYGFGLCKNSRYYGSFDYYWGAESEKRIRDWRERNLKNSDYEFRKYGKGWAIYWFLPKGRTYGEYEVVTSNEARSLFEKLEVDIKRKAWRPRIEYQIYSHPIKSYYENRFGDLLRFVLPVFILTFPIVPLCYLYAFIVAYTPPSLVQITVWIPPIIIFSLLIWMFLKSFEIKFLKKE
jgi:hypothetical protein